MQQNVLPEISKVNHYQEEIIAEEGMSLGYLPQKLSFTAISVY